MAKVMIAGTEKIAARGPGEGKDFTKAAAEAQAEKMNKEAERLGIETRYEVKA